MTKIALYARVSTHDQRPEVQLHALRRYAEDRGAEAVEYVDRGVSGAAAARPALDEMLRDVRRRGVSAVVVVKLDRLARSVSHLVKLAEELEATGVGLVVLDQGVDTDTPTGKLLFHVLGALAEFERELIRERVVAGLSAAKRRGQKLGRPERADKPTRARILRLRKAGRSLREIAEVVGIPKSTVARVVKQAAAA